MRDTNIDRLILANLSFLYYPSYPEDTILMSLDGKMISFVKYLSTALSMLAEVSCRFTIIRRRSACGRNMKPKIL
jgi:hypothetical protein